MTHVQHSIAAGRWQFVAGPGFDIVNNGDSVQAVNGRRAIYVGTMAVGGAGVASDASHLRAILAKRLGDGERISHVCPNVQGDAEVLKNGDRWRLNGSMCADGSVATCVIDFETLEQRAWAEDTWKSLTLGTGG